MQVKRASFYAVAALDTIGMEEPFFVIPALIWFQLHRAHCRAQFTFGSAPFSYQNAAVVVGKSAAAGSYP